MSYQALARKYRPQTFRDLIGQDTIVRTLRNAIEQKRIHHAYLFSGVRGIGKTSTARILAKALNCATGPTIEPCNTCDPCREITEGIDLDVREIDAATYTQVDNIRELREVSQFQPARDRYRIFIIDEAHMLSTPAWNALLKLIEEPPPHVVFMMATTEMQKVPATILSRVQQFTFRRITADELTTRLAEIADLEGIKADRDGLRLIAQRGDGSVRDSLSLLDQIIAFSGREFSENDVVQTLGLADAGFFDTIAERILEGDVAGLMEALHSAAEQGRDFKLLYRDFLGYLRTLLLIRSGAELQGMVITGSMRGIADQFEPTELLRLLNALLRDDETISRTEQQRLAVEVSLLKAAALPRLRSVESVLRGEGGEPAGQTPPRSNPARRETPPSPQESKTSADRAGSTRSSDPLRDALDAIAGERRMLATYLSECRIALTDEGATITIPAGNDMAERMIREEGALAIITRAFRAAMASDATVAVVSEKQSAQSRGAEPEGGAIDDPVLKSLQRHLGGEVVRPRGTRQGGV